MKKNLVRDWMTPQPLTIGPKTTVPEAHKLMNDHHIRRLPVVDKGKLVGIVTLGDLREAEPSDASTLTVYELNYLVALLTVDKIMTREVITIAPDMPLRKAAKLMLNYKIGGLPVVANERVVGIITESDILRVLVDELDPLTTVE